MSLRDSDRGPDGRSSDLPSGQGVPAWMGDNLNFCTRCGGPLRFARVAGEERERFVCAACGHVAYVNPRLVVTTLPITDAGEIVLIRRGIEPGIGLWAQPGGFLEVDETVHQAAVRETYEETRLLVEPTEIVGLYTRLESAVVTIVFEAQVTGGKAAVTPEASEICAYPADTLPWPELAFRSTYWALRDWLRLRHPDVEPTTAEHGR